MSVLPIAAAALVLVGMHGMLALNQPVKRVLAANVLGSGIFLLLLTITRDSSGGVDPVPQAMVLTGIVVSFAATALSLVLIRSLRAIPESGAPNEDGRHDD